MRHAGNGMADVVDPAPEWARGKDAPAHMRPLQRKR